MIGKMGRQQTYKCSKCDYSVLTSGGLDFGFIATTKTYICKNCNEVVDFLVATK